MKQCKQLKSFLVEDKDTPILHSQYQDFAQHEDGRHQGITRFDFGLVPPK